jgi:hypothetical protein
MNTNMKEFDWFTEQWAEEAYSRTTELIRIYMVAYDAASHMSYPYEWVSLGGIWGSRKILVVRAFTRDAVIRHIQINLITMRVLADREFIISHPVKSEISLGVRNTAPDDAKKRAAYELSIFEEKRQRVAGYLKDALIEFEALEKFVSKYKNTTNKIAGQMLKLVIRISPLGFITWFVTQFQKLPDLPLLHAITLCLLWIIGYNLLGMLGIPFHDADYRKYNLFEGFMGNPTDGIRPLEPPVSRREQDFYTHLGIGKPVIISWEVLIPVVHYVVTILMVIVSIIMLPLNQQGRIIASVIGLIIVMAQIKKILLWRILIKGRYNKLTFVKLLLSFFV